MTCCLLKGVGQYVTNIMLYNREHKKYNSYILLS